MVAQDVANLLKDGEVCGGDAVDDFAVQSAKNVQKLIFMFKHHGIGGLNGFRQKDLFLVTHE